MNYVSNGVSQSGQDSGSSATMQAIMSYIGQLQAGGGASTPSSTMGLNEFGGQGFNPSGVSDAAVAAAGGGGAYPAGAYSGYDTSIYGPLGVKSTSEY